MPDEPQVSAKWTGPVGSNSDAGPISVLIKLELDLARTLTPEHDAVLGGAIRAAAQRLIADTEAAK
jgi:hypothetical protein